MKSLNTSLLSLGATVALLAAVAGCARHEVVASDSASSQSRMNEVSQAPMTPSVTPDMPSASMQRADTTGMASSTAPTAAPMSSSANSYSGSSTSANPQATSAYRSDTEQPPLRVDRN